MIPAVLPAAADAAEPVPAARAPKGTPFAAVIDAVPADGAADPKADAPDAEPAAADATPAADGTLATSPGAPTTMADAAALIAQLCPAAPTPTTQSTMVDVPAAACRSREAGTPAPAVEPDTRFRGNDAALEGKAAPHPGKPVRQLGKSAPIRLDAFTDAAAKAVEAPVVAAAAPARAADAILTADTLPALSPGDVAITHHLDLAHDAQWLDRLAQDIARSADQNANLRFSLTPEHLGRLTVELAAGADGTAVRLTTESEQAHRIVSDAQPRLVAEARAQGLRISETQVDLDRRSGGGQPHQRSPDARADQDRARPAVVWTESPQRPTGAAAQRVPTARDLYA